MDRRLTALIVFASLVIAPLCAHAQDPGYPVKPIRLIMPSPPGSPGDLAGRLIGEKLSGALAQPLVFDNRPGAAGLIGMEAIARAPADGYTLGVIGLPYVVAAILAPKAPYDTEKDFAPIAQVDWAYQVLVVPAASPAKSVAELVAAAKAKPGALRFSSGGNGTPSHLLGELFKRAARLDITHIPYKGAPPASLAVLTAEVDMMIGPIGPLAPHIKAGKLRALATPAPQRNAAYPELPTLVELGYPGIHVRDWHGFIAPAGTPKHVIARLHAEIAKATAMPDVKQRLEGFGMEAASMGPAEFAVHIRSELERWGGLVRDAGIKAD
jgi:tripartite-type tricarboxylate transporter receptor subunit TctC